MKIVVIGGISHSLINFRGPLLKTLLLAGHSVFTVAGCTSPSEHQRLTALGVVHFDIPMDRAGLNPLKDFQLLVHYTRLLYQIRPDYLLSYTIKPVIYGSIAAAIARIPHVFSIITGLGYGFAGTSIKRRLLTKICSILYKISLWNNAVVFFQNPDDETLFYENRIIRYGARTKIINGSGVDLNHYSSAALPESPTFLLIARLLAEKGIREYAAAAKIIKNKYPKAMFYLVGSIDPNPSSISKTELENWIEDGVLNYLGFVEDVRKIIAKTTVYVLPSYYREGTPRTILEAMAMGRAIITTDAPGCRETVHSETICTNRVNGNKIQKGSNGFLVPVRDVASLAKAMESFILDVSLAPKMGICSLKIASFKYDVHSVNTEILKAMELNEPRRN
jgi:glycosyltransferase involved in cell wall biosynthesis